MHNKQLAEIYLISEAALWDFIFHSALEQIQPHLSAIRRRGKPGKEAARSTACLKLQAKGRGGGGKKNPERKDPGAEENKASSRETDRQVA